MKSLTVNVGQNQQFFFFKIFKNTPADFLNEFLHEFVIDC